MTNGNFMITKVIIIIIIIKIKLTILIVIMIVILIIMTIIIMTKMMIKTNKIVIQIANKKWYDNHHYDDN